MDAVFVLLDGGDGDFWMEDVCGAVDGRNTTEGLRDVSYSVVNVEIRDFSIDTTRFYEFSEFLNESFEGVKPACEDRNGLVVVILVVAYDISEVIHDFSIFLD